MTNTLVVFVAGIIFVTFALPIVDEIIQIISAICELIKSKISTVIAKNNFIIQLYQQPESNSNVIGFTVNDDCDEYDDDEEDDCKNNFCDVIKSKYRSEVKHLNKNKIGF